MIFWLATLLELATVKFATKFYFFSRTQRDAGGCGVRTEKKAGSPLNCVPASAYRCMFAPAERYLVAEFRLNFSQIERCAQPADDG